MNEHDRIATSFSKQLYNEGYRKIILNTGLEQTISKFFISNEITEYQPDIIAEKDSLKYFFEVETKKTLKHPGIVRQWQLISKKSDCNNCFNIVVENDLIKTVQAICDIYDIDANLIEASNKN